MSPTFQRYVGVDIAAKTFAATWASDPRTAPRAAIFPQNLDGFTSLRQQLALTTIAPAATRIVLEATGSYWVALAVDLHQAGYGVSVVNPGHVAQYARSLPRRGKTDALDAQVLIRFAYERQPARWTPLVQVYHELRQRLVVRDGLLEMRTQARNQRHAVQPWPVQIVGAVQALDTVLAELDTQLAMLERDLAQVLAHGAWAASAALLLDTPGIGLVTTAWLLVGTLNFTSAASPEQLVAYVGLAPCPANQAPVSGDDRTLVMAVTSGSARPCIWRP